MTAARRTRPEKLSFPRIVVPLIALIFVGLVMMRIWRYAEARATDRAMPVAISDERERMLFQSAQGAYTASDIAANGGELPSEKFRSFVPAHDLQPRPGDRLCPVTRTKGNSDCTWMVGGQIYEFCCPPCIAEFVIKAKQNPEQILPAEAYVKGTL